MEAKKRLFSYLKPFKGSLILASIFSLLFVVSQISQPFLLGRALDASKDEFIVYIIVSLVLAIVGVVSSYIFEVIVMNSSQKIIKKARDDVYQKINNIALKDFDNKYRGDLLFIKR